MGPYHWKTHTGTHELSHVSKLNITQEEYFYRDRCDTLSFPQFVDTCDRYTFQVLVDHSTCVIKVTIKSDSSTVISGASDGCIMVWEVSSGECIHKLNTHTSCITSLKFLSNEQFVISCKIYYNSLTFSTF